MTDDVSVVLTFRVLVCCQNPCICPAQVYERKVHCLSNYNAEEPHAPWSIAAGCGVAVLP